MCWAGLDRAYRIQRAGFLRDLTIDLDAARAKAANALLRAMKDKALRNGPKDDSYDASLAQLAIVGFPDREVCDTTVSQIKHSLALRHEERDRVFLPVSAAR